MALRHVRRAKVVTLFKLLCLSRDGIFQEDIQKVADEAFGGETVSHQSRLLVVLAGTRTPSYRVIKMVFTNFLSSQVSRGLRAQRCEGDFVELALSHCKSGTHGSGDRRIPSICRRLFPKGVPQTPQLNELTGLLT